MMRHWIISACAIVGLAVAAAGCGGGDDEKTIDLGDGGEVTVGGDLPDSFPDDFPVYDGAELQGAVQGEQDGIEGIVATWTTGDDFDDVTAFYDDAFADGPWTVTTEGTAGGSSYWAVENADSDKAGYVAVSDGDEVSIVATVGDNPDSATSGDGSGDGTDDGTDDGAGDGGDEPSSDDGGSGGTDATLPDEIDLPDDFPTDTVPLVDDAHVTTANTITSNGVQMITIGYYSKESAADIASFYKDHLEGERYTQSIQTSDDTGVYAAYSENSDGSGKIVVVTASDGDIEGYRQVVLQVTG